LDWLIGGVMACEEEDLRVELLVDVHAVVLGCKMVWEFV